MHDHACVIIIGGGAMGCSLAYHLTKCGRHDVVLVEKNELTAGSTWHAAGLCTHFAHNLTVMHMRAHSVRLYSGVLEEDTGSPVSFHRTGALRVTRSGDRMKEFRHVQGLGKFAGFDFHILTPDELAKVHPLADTSDILGAIHEPLDGHVDPSQATHAMAAGARAGGAAIHRHTKVMGIERNRSGEWVVETDQGSIVGEHLVNAAGTWAYEIGRMMGLELPVVPILHQYLVTDRIEAVAALDRELPIIRDAEESWYVRQERDGLIVGPYERDGVPWSIDAVPPDFGMELLPPDLDRIEDIVEAAMNRVPALAAGGIKTVVNGPITFTPDAGPLIGPAFGCENGWLLTGSSMGVMEGGGAGKFLAEWMVGGEPPMDPLAVDSRRFGAYADRDFRIAKAIECFGNQFAIHYPYEEREAGRPKRVSAIHDRLRAAGAVFGVAYGWERPNWFAPEGADRRSTLSFGRANWFDAVGAECLAVRDRVGLADMSVFSKFLISGPDAVPFMESLGANRPPRSIGRIGLIHVLTASGGVLSEFTVTRTGEDGFYLTSAAAAERQDGDVLRAHAKAFSGVTIERVSDRIGVLSLMGARSRELLEILCDADLSNGALPWLSSADLTVAGVRARALRVSYVGEFGYELHCDMADLPLLYDALIREGGAFGLKHFGAFAMNSMRLEKGYRAWGVDYTTERTPLEAGVASFVKLDGRTFTGRDALAKHSNRADIKEMVLLRLADDGPDPFYGHLVLSNGRCVGLVTSGSFGHRTGAKLALAYLDAGSGDLTLEVEITGERLAAQILERPPYDPDNARLINGAG